MAISTIWVLATLSVRITVLGSMSISSRSSSARVSATIFFLSISPHRPNGSRPKKIFSATVM